MNTSPPNPTGGTPPPSNAATASNPPMPTTGVSGTTAPSTTGGNVPSGNGSNIPPTTHGPNSAQQAGSTSGVPPSNQHGSTNPSTIPSNTHGSTNPPTNPSNNGSIAISPNSNGPPSTGGPTLTAANPIPGVPTSAGTPGGGGFQGAHQPLGATHNISDLERKFCPTMAILIPQIHYDSTTSVHSTRNMVLHGGKPNVDWTGLEEASEEFTNNITRVGKKVDLTASGFMDKVKLIAKTPSMRLGSRNGSFSQDLVPRLKEIGNDFGFSTMFYAPSTMSGTRKMENLLFKHHQFESVHAVRLEMNTLRSKAWDANDRHANDAMWTLLEQMCGHKFWQEQVGPKIISVDGVKDTFQTVLKIVADALSDTSMNVVQSLQTQIGQINVNQFPGQNITQCCITVRKVFDELSRLRALDLENHRTIIDQLLAAAPNPSEQLRNIYHNPLNSIAQKFHQEVSRIRLIDSYKARNDELVVLGLDYSSILATATNGYEHAIQANYWEPAQQVPTVQMASASLDGNVHQQRTNRVTFQRTNQASNSNRNQRNHHQSPHGRNTGNRNNNGNHGNHRNNQTILRNGDTQFRNRRQQQRDRNQTRRPNRGQGDWKTTAPAPGAPQVIFRNGRDWKWCAKCNYGGGRWSTTHSTVEHRELPDGNNGRSEAEALYASYEDPGVWTAALEVPDNSFFNTFLLLIGSGITFMLLSIFMNVTAPVEFPSASTLIVDLLNACKFAVTDLFIPTSNLLGSLMIHLFRETSTFLSNEGPKLLGQHYDCAPAVLFWMFLLAMSKTIPLLGATTAPTTNENDNDTTVNRRSRRAFAQHLRRERRSSTVRQPSIRSERFHRSYPRRLRIRNSFERRPNFTARNRAIPTMPRRRHRSSFLRNLHSSPRIQHSPTQRTTFGPAFHSNQRRHTRQARRRHNTDSGSTRPPPAPTYLGRHHPHANAVLFDHQPNLVTTVGDAITPVTTDTISPTVTQTNDIEFHFGPNIPDQLASTVIPEPTTPLEPFMYPIEPEVINTATAEDDDEASNIVEIYSDFTDDHCVASGGDENAIDEIQAEGGIPSLIQRDDDSSEETMMPRRFDRDDESSDEFSMPQLIVRDDDSSDEDEDFQIGSTTERTPTATIPDEIEVLLNGVGNIDSTFYEDVDVFLHDVDPDAITNLESALGGDFLEPEDLGSRIWGLLTALLTSAKFLSPTETVVDDRTLIWDTGASITVTPFKEDFVGAIQPPTERRFVRGLGSKPIEGFGRVKYLVLDSKGWIRTIELPAIHVPSIPKRLLSTQQFAKAYNESATVDGTKLSTAGIPNDPTRNPIDAYHSLRNNLPTSRLYSPDDFKDGLMSLNATITSTSEANMNLNEAEKELLRWHYKLGHINLRRIQHLMRSGTLSHTESSRRLHTRCVKCTTKPKCAACQFGKQKRRSTPGKKQIVVRDRIDSTKTNVLFPGQRVSVDHFVCSARGRLFDGFGKGSDSNKYVGGIMFTDVATGHIWVDFLKHLNTHETLHAVKRYEEMCLDNGGVIVQEYVADQASSFTSQEFQLHLSNFRQIIKFAGTAGHHHNLVERSIQTIMCMARTMLLHSAIHWPAVANTQLWPMAVQHAMFIYNHMPREDSGQSPSDLFTKTRWDRRKFHDLHTFGCPVYVLDKDLADGRKIPRWKPRSHRCIYLGTTERFASSVPLVLNPTTGAITTPYHVVMDDWFATVTTSVDNLPNFESTEWTKLFGDSSFQYPSDDEDEHFEDPVSDYEIQQILRASNRLQRTATAREQGIPIIPLDVPPPALQSTPSPHSNATPTTDHLHIPSLEPATSPMSPVQEESFDQSPLFDNDNSTILPTSTPTNAPTATSSTNAPTASTTAPTAPTTAPIATPNAPTAPTVSAEPSRYPTRSRKSPNRLTATTAGNLENAFISQLDTPECDTNVVDNDDHWARTESMFICLTDSDDPNNIMDLVHRYNFYEHDPVAAFKASIDDPDTLSWKEAMNDREERHEWIQGAQKEIEGLYNMNAIEEVPITQATSKVLPGQLLCKRKRAPGEHGKPGIVLKHKVRFALRGDLEELDPNEDTYAPVTKWSTIRMIMVFAMLLGWSIGSIDFSQAFLHAPLETPIYVHLPPTFVSNLNVKSCLKMTRSCYGRRIASKLWYEHLRKAMVELGFSVSDFDDCLFYNNGIMIAFFVDDGFACVRDINILDKLVKDLAGLGFKLTIEREVDSFLGVKIDKLNDGSFNLTQPTLIDKILDITGLNDCNANYIPADRVPLGLDPDGLPHDETWSYSTVVGMLLFLITNTRPDCAYAVSQVARFNHNPKQSHSIAVKRIVRYLKGTADKGMIIRTNGTLDLELFTDGDFAGRYQSDPPRETSSARSRISYIAYLSGVPLFWRTQLLSCICLSTCEVEYAAISHGMRALIPVRRLLNEMVANIGNGHTTSLPVVRSSVFTDNASALILAATQRLTNRTRYFHTQWHHFWQYVQGPTAADETSNERVVAKRVDTKENPADNGTKGNVRTIFEYLRWFTNGWR